jgi:hypothetical protein
VWLQFGEGVHYTLKLLSICLNAQHLERPGEFRLQYFLKRLVATRMREGEGIP